MEHFDRLSELLMQTNKLSVELFSKVAEQYGISHAEIFLLQQIKKSPKTIGELSRLSGFPYSTISGVVSRLEAGGYVVRQKDQQDRRVVWVRLADDVEQLERRLPFLGKTYVHELFAGMTKEEVEKLCESFRLVNSYLLKKLEEQGKRERK